MKTLLTAVALFIAGAAFSQNTLDITNRSREVIGDVVVSYKGGGTETVFVGSTGDYHFEIGSKEVEALIYGTTVCPLGETVKFTPPGSLVSLLTRLLESIQDEGKGFSSLIR